MLNDQNCATGIPSIPLARQPTSLGKPSLADLLDAVSADPDLPQAKRVRWRSCLLRTAKYLGRDLSALPAHMTGLRYGIARLHHAQLGISEKNLQNLKSDLKAILRYTGRLDAPSPRSVKLAPEWDNLDLSLTDTRLRRGLSAFMRYCSWQEIPPNAVDDDVADRFTAATSESRFSTNPREVRKTVARCWNRASAKVPDWPGTKLTVPDHRPGGRSIDWECFPQSFRDDVEAYLSRLSGRGGILEDAPDRPCKESTIKVRRRCIHLAASAAIKSGLPIERIRSLSDLVAPSTVKSVLECYLPANGEAPRVFVSNLCGLLTSIAMRWSKLTDEDIAKLKEYRRRLDRERAPGLTPKNMAVIRAMQDPTSRQRLLRLPHVLMEEAQGPNMSLHRAAVRAQIALALLILIHAPMRIGNLVALSLEDNVLEPAGPAGPVHLYIPAEGVKNHQPLEYPLPDEVGEMLRLYVRMFRHCLRGSNSPWLFPGLLGGHKEARTMSQQLTETIERAIGVRITPHQLRHIAAAIILEADPGNYELVRRVLGHRNIQTTINHYIGLETVDAVRQYNRLVLGASNGAPEARP